MALRPRRKFGVAFAIVSIFSVSAVALGLYVLVFLLGVAIVVRFHPTDAESQRRSLIAGWSLVFIAVGFLATYPRITPQPGEPSQSAVTWMERDNLFRARWGALKWSALEVASGSPGAGTLLFAELEYRLGRTESALDTLSGIWSTNATPETRRRAAILFASWAKERSQAKPTPSVTPVTR